MGISFRSQSPAIRSRSTISHALMADSTLWLVTGGTISDWIRPIGVIGWWSTTDSLWWCISEMLLSLLKGQVVFQIPIPLTGYTLLCVSDYVGNHVDTSKQWTVCHPHSLVGRALRDWVVLVMVPCSGVSVNPLSGTRSSRFKLTRSRGILLNISLSSSAQVGWATLASHVIVCSRV